MKKEIIVKKSVVYVTRALVNVPDDATPEDVLREASKVINDGELEINDWTYVHEYLEPLCS